VSECQKALYEAMRIQANELGQGYQNSVEKMRCSKIKTRLQVQMLSMNFEAFASLDILRLKAFETEVNVALTNPNA
jgi:hypothetical protein